MKGPKTLLAEAIASALEEYFIVDHIESQLLSDAAVTLNHTALKHRYIDVSATTRASIQGFVEKVAFEWHWGKSDKEGGSDLIKDTTLTLEGLDFTISLTRNNIDGEDASTEDEAIQNDEPQQQAQQQQSTKGSIMQYVQNQVERIMDTVTLQIKNCKLTIILPGGQSELEFGFSSIEVNSMGRQQVGLPLLQELILQSLYCSAIQAEVKYPILEEITYVAQSERTFGRRFSSWNQGVDVMGQSNDHGVVLHAGEIQMQVLSQLVGVLLEAPAAVPSLSETGSFEVEVDHEGVGMATSAEYHTNSDSLEDNKEELEEERPPSYIQLPLAGVSIILPNQTKLAISELVLKYQMDGSIFSLEGKQGITVNDNSPFLWLGETSIWMADMTTSEFRIYDPTILKTTAEEDAVGQEDDEFVAYICANTAELGRVFAGVMGAMGILRDTASDHINTTTATKTNDDQTKSSWTIHVPGVLGCLLETGDTNIELTVCNLQAKLASMSVTTKITKFQYPGVLHLAEPIEVAFFRYDGTSASVSAILHDVVVVLKEKKSTETTIEVSDEASSSHDEPTSLSVASTNATPGFSLPFGVNLSVNKFLSFKADAKSVHTTMEGLDFKMDPTATESNPVDDRTRVTISVDELNHDMVRLQYAHFKSIFVLSNWDPVTSFHFGAKAIYVAAGYSLGDWKSLLPKKKVNQIENTPLRLPFAKVDKLKVIAVVKGVIGVNDTVINADPFVGKENTTTDDIVSFYSAEVTTQIPGMIGNAQILGTNVEDQVVSNYGGALLGNLVGGAGVGGLISVAAFDGVRNTIKEGKVARGVEETDDWRFSDIARGLQHAALRATQEGAARRGKDGGEDGDVIDWAVGATADATKYADENKGRLAGAGAGAIGFAYGLALGGPIGAVVGTLVASVATQKTVETIDEATKKLTIGDKSVVFHDTNPEIKRQHHNNELLFSGILLKRRDLVRWDWRTHYFLLRKGSLEYFVLSDKPPEGYKAQKTANIFYDSSRPRKSLDFVNHFVAFDGNLSKPESNLFVFCIFSLESTEPLWTLAASSEESRKEWVSAIEGAMASEDGNDIRRSRVSLRSSVTKLDNAKRKSIRNSLPPELGDLVMQ